MFGHSSVKQPTMYFRYESRCLLTIVNLQLEKTIEGNKHSRALFAK